MRYLIDENLPRKFNIWNTSDYVHQHDIDPRSSDLEIWNYAKANNLTIISKDSDFSNRVLLLGAPPKVIHIRLGNMNMRAFHAAISQCWYAVMALSENHKLVWVYPNRIEGIA